MKNRMNIRDTIIFGLANSGLFYVSRKVHDWLIPSYIRVFNYHDIPPHEFDNFKVQVEYLCSKFRCAHPSEISSLVQGENLEKSEPAFLLTFDDGFESHGTYVADYLTTMGITAIFFVPGAAPDVVPSKQEVWALEHVVLKARQSAAIQGRVFASWNTWQKKVKNHIIASHTHDHVRFTDAVNKAEVIKQVTNSFESLQKELGSCCKRFCWVGGELDSYSEEGVSGLAEAGAIECYTTCSRVITSGVDSRRIERTNLESSYSMARVSLAISGLVDIRYVMKRKKLDRLYRRD